MANSLPRHQILLALIGNRSVLLVLFFAHPTLAKQKKKDTGVRE